MNYMKNANLFLVASVVLILGAVAVIAVMDRNSSKDGTDVRARASSKTVSALQMTGVVSAVDETKGIVTVDNMQFSQKSLAGTPKNLGQFTVTPPAGFNFAGISPGMQVVMDIDATTFQVTSHSITALTLVQGK